ncbi:hypothetical protein [Actinophytocola oryzae]|uniref:DUF2975 domain-containing protein n=1 Tax=Actinophytocola oryzae TaxID=502181 RepID=A0A4R7V7U3_9PSEU|nr:hypothetical protein [Actinophytocola oryzae]TDV44285.1 hypothetical protein CLV71_114195 [Actinophytocola oryzae]
MRAEWNPLRSLAGVARFVTWVFGLAALAIVIANVAALGWLPGSGANPTCVDVGGDVGPLREDARVAAGGGSVCVDNPTGTQRIADIGDQVPQALFALGALWLLLRFLRTASDAGPYEASVPGRLAALGWFVLVGGPVSELLFALSVHSLRTSMISGVPSTDWVAQWRAEFPWWALAAGLAALVFAHILRIGVRMPEAPARSGD